MRVRGRRRLRVANLTGLACLVGLLGCSPLYVLRAGYEEAKILWYRTPIRTLLQDDTRLDAAARDKLRLVLRVRGFARHDLGFRVGKSYASLSQLPTPLTIHVVTAAHRTRLESHTWWFPIVGRVAYKGFFRAAAAEAEARRLQAAGFDTAIRTAAAFSTLGWFDDPLLPHLLHYDQPVLTNIVLHELFHNTFYLPGNTAFNESLANFAGHRGTIAFFTRQYGAAHERTQAVRDAWQAELAVAEFFAQARARLTAVYDSPLSDTEKLARRRTLFLQLQAEFRALPRKPASTLDFGSCAVNNAVILQYLTYLSDLDVFERVYHQNSQDLKRSLDEIVLHAADADNPFEAVRRGSRSHSSLRLMRQTPAPPLRPRLRDLRRNGRHRQSSPAARPPAWWRRVA